MNLNKTKSPTYNVIPFQSTFNYISPWDLEEIMESLDDMGYLTDKGQRFRRAFWRLYIRKT